MGNLAPMPDRVLDRPYLLIVPLPIYLDSSGQQWIDRLWLRDLARHVHYLPRLTLASPAEDKQPDSPDLVPFRLCEESSLRWVCLPYGRSWRRCLPALPRLVKTLWRAVGDVDIVHSGVAGWPIPLGWIANPIALLRRRRLVLVVESSFWRVTPGLRATWRGRLRSGFSEAVARAFVRRASLSLFTHRGYAEQLAVGARGAVHVEPAVWVDPNDIVDDKQAESDSRHKSEAPRAKFLFAGRLEPAKGADLLLAALLRLDANGQSVEVDFLGRGAWQARVVEASKRFQSVRVRHLEPLPYGESLFVFLRNYHALLVPSRSDEQPRIVFDAFSQAVTVLATRTPGLESCVEDGRTGVLVDRDDPAALAEAIAEWSRNPAGLVALGLAARAFVGFHTHQGMHERRRELLIKLFGGQAGTLRRVPGGYVELIPAVAARPASRALPNDQPSAATRGDEPRP